MRELPPTPFCGNCGKKFTKTNYTVLELGVFKCHNCEEKGINTDNGHEVFANNSTATATIIPTGVMGNKILVTRRSESMRVAPGGLCLPGGHVMRGESWQLNTIREAQEEAGAIIRDNLVEYPRIFDAISNPSGTLTILISIARAFHIDTSKANHEVSEVIEIGPDHPEKMCFPLQQKAVEQYWEYCASYKRLEGLISSHVSDREMILWRKDLQTISRLGSFR